MSLEHSPSQASESNAGGAPRRAAYSIDEFCQMHCISRALLYQMLKEGTGPRTMKVRGRRLISTEAAEQWRRERETEAEGD